jgi:ORF6N domain
MHPNRFHLCLRLPTLTDQLSTSPKIPPLELIFRYFRASYRKKFQLGFCLTNGFVGIQGDNRLETGKRCSARLLHSWRKVLLDADLAMLYGVEPRVLNQAVARNRKRFPADFVFQLSAREYDALTSQIVISDKDDARGASALRSQIVISKKGRGGRRYLPYAFTEQGVAMLSSVLRSARAV